MRLIAFLNDRGQPALGAHRGRATAFDHAAESNFDVPKHPVVFQRYPSSWVAHGEPLVRPHVSTQFDYEAELVAVIGQAGRYIAKDKALEHVAGYSIAAVAPTRRTRARTRWPRCPRA